MKNKRFTTEVGLYALAAGLALFVRLLGLGLNPLSSYEAGWALQALDFARDQVMTSSAQPGYVALSGLIFSLFGTSDFTARLVPALAGVSLTLLPLFLRKYVGRFPALILAFFLAFDPGLVSVSRQAGGSGMAVAFVVLGLGAWFNHRRILAGVFCGLALLSGPASWQGLIIMIIAWLLVVLLEAVGLIHTNTDQVSENSRYAFLPRELGTVLTALALTVLAAGLLFFKYPSAIGGIGDSLVSYLAGWTKSSGIPVLRLPAALLIYQPFAVIFGLWEAVQAWVHRRPEDAAAQRLSLWFMVALLIVTIPPGRQVDNLVWVLVPLLALAAIGLVRVFRLQLSGQNLSAAGGMAVLIFVIVIFGWNFIIGARTLTGDQALQVQSNIIYILIGTVAMIGVAAALIALGWNLNTALTGTGWGLILVLVPFWISTLWGTMGLSPTSRQEMWGYGPSAGQVNLLSQTMEDLSEWSTGMRTSMNVIVLPENPSLKWALRDWHGVQFASSIEPDTMPPAIITLAGQEPPALAATYAGQDFILETTPDWQGVLPQDFLLWVAFRSSPVVDTTAILWARSDLFSGGAISTTTDIAP